MSSIGSNIGSSVWSNIGCSIGSSIGSSLGSNIMSSIDFTAEFRRQPLVIYNCINLCTYAQSSVSFLKKKFHILLVLVFKEFL